MLSFLVLSVNGFIVRFSISTRNQKDMMLLVLSVNEIQRSFSNTKKKKERKDNAKFNITFIYNTFTFQDKFFFSSLFQSNFFDSYNEPIVQWTQ